MTNEPQAAVGRIAWTIRIDLTGLERAQQRPQVGALQTLRPGTPVELVIGDVSVWDVEPSVPRLLYEAVHTRSLAIRLCGAPHVLSNWYAALRYREPHPKRPDHLRLVDGGDG